MTNHRPSDAPTDEISQAELIRRLEHRCDMEASHIAELKEQVRTIALERDAAREKVAKIMAGLEGCCMTCEPVGARNQQMERDIETLKDERDLLRQNLCKVLDPARPLTAEEIARLCWDCCQNLRLPQLSKTDKDETK